MPYEEGSSKPQEADLIGITYGDWQTVLFGFTYIRELEDMVAWQDSIIAAQDEKIGYMRDQLNLERQQREELVGIIKEKDDIISRGDKREKRQKLENNILKFGGGGLAATLLGLYLWKEITD